MSAIKGLEACYVAVVVLQILYTGICFFHRSRDFDDLTDLENKHLRYRL